MEFLEILNEDGSSTGTCKERCGVHRDGDLHGSSHVWVIRDLRTDGSFDVLLQRRSPDKDSYPDCLDTSCAGHIAAGDTFDSTALRELEEELGIKPDQTPAYLFDHMTSWEAEFRGQKFINREISRVYLLYPSRPVDLEEFQREEISELLWQDADTVLAALRSGDPRYCIRLSLFEKLVETVSHMQPVRPINPND